MPKEIYVTVSFKTSDGGEHVTDLPLFTMNEELKVTDLSWSSREVLLDDQGVPK